MLMSVFASSARWRSGLGRTAAVGPARAAELPSRRHRIDDSTRTEGSFEWLARTDGVFGLSEH